MSRLQRDALIPPGSILIQFGGLAYFRLLRTSRIFFLPSTKLADSAKWRGAVAMINNPEEPWRMMVLYPSFCRFLANYAEQGRDLYVFSRCLSFADMQTRQLIHVLLQAKKQARIERLNSSLNIAKSTFFNSPSSALFYELDTSFRADQDILTWAIRNLNIDCIFKLNNEIPFTGPDIIIEFLRRILESSTFMPSHFLSLWNQISPDQRAKLFLDHWCNDQLLFAHLLNQQDLGVYRNDIISHFVESARKWRTPSISQMMAEFGEDRQFVDIILSLVKHEKTIAREVWVCDQLKRHPLVLSVSQAPMVQNPVHPVVIHPVRFLIQHPEALVRPEFRYFLEPDMLPVLVQLFNTDPTTVVGSSPCRIFDRFDLFLKSYLENNPPTSQLQSLYKPIELFYMFAEQDILESNVEAAIFQLCFEPTSPPQIVEKIVEYRSMYGNEDNPKLAITEAMLVQILDLHPTIVVPDSFLFYENRRQFVLSYCHRLSSKRARSLDLTRLSQLFYNSKRDHQVKIIQNLKICNQFEILQAFRDCMPQDLKAEIFGI